MDIWLYFLGMVVIWVGFKLSMRTLFYVLCCVLFTIETGVKSLLQLVTKVTRT